jgi:integrase
MNEHLWKICTDLYFPRNLKLRSDKTRIQYRYAIDAFSEHLGRPATAADLDDDTITVWVGKLLARCDDPADGLSVYTVREKLGRILSLWRWLAARRVVDRWPTITRPEAPEPMPIALTEDELRRLFEAAQWEPGKIGGVQARFWWPAFFGFVFSTSERVGAALALRWEWIDTAKRVIVIPPSVRKGRRKAGVYPLWPELMPLLDRIKEPKRDLVFPWDKSQGCYYGRYGRILRRAELPDDRKHKTHSLRVSHATWLKVMGGDPTRRLGHGESSTTNRHYIDVRHLPPEENRLFIPWQPDDRRAG